MTRYFAVPILATMLALVAVRSMATPAPRVEAPPAFVFSLTSQDPEPAAPAPQPVAAPAEVPVAAPPAPKAEPAVIVLEPLPQPEPTVRTEVVERTVYVPQPQTVIYAPTTIYAPVIEAPPPPPQEAVETPVIVIVNSPHGRPAPLPKRPSAKQDPFFKEIPFLPPTPKGPRWSP